VQCPVDTLLKLFPKLKQDEVETALINLLEEGYLMVHRVDTNSITSSSLFMLPCFPRPFSYEEDSHNKPITYREQLQLIYYEVEVVHTKAIGYLRKAKEEKENAKRKKWDDRRWNLFQGAVLGIITTLTVQWIIRLIWR
jgi:hypothetical protein